ncbi:MAG: glycosyltransferase family 4 protein [Candidatus Scalinduaceae bacterium]
MTLCMNMNYCDNDNTEKKKKILMLNFEFPPIGGGAANANYYLLKEFAKDPELEIDLVTSSVSSTFESERFSNNIEIFKLNINKKDLQYWRMSEIALWTWKAYWFSKRLVKKNNYDLCHCWFGWPAGIIGFLLRKNISYIVALRGSDVPDYNARLRALDKNYFKFISTIVWQNAKTVAANSKNLRELARKTYDKKSIHVIYNGVNITEFKPDINRSELNVLFVGRLIKRKGVIYLIKAYKEVCDGYNNFKLIIVGGGPEREYLENFCKLAKIETKVEFLGAVKHKDIAGIYQKANILVLPSLEESLANVTLEAMASGLPIITTNTGAAELMDGNGFIVEKENYKQIKEAIIQYVDNPELLMKHGKKSRKTAEKMSWTNAAKAYIRIYDSIIK